MMISESQRSLLRTLVESDGAFRLEKLQEEEAYLIVTLKLTRPDGEVLLPPILDGFDIEAFSLKGGTVRLSAPVMEASGVPAEAKWVYDGLDEVLAKHGYRHEGDIFRSEKPNREHRKKRAGKT